MDSTKLIVLFRRISILAFYNFAFSFFVNGESLFIPEPRLENELAKTLRVAREDLTKELVSEKLIYFQLNNAGIRDLTGLEAAKNLRILVLKDNLIEDISALCDLPNLEKLDLSGNKISDISAFSGLSLRLMQEQASLIQEKLADYKTPKNEVAALVLQLSELIERVKQGSWQLKELSLANNRLLGLSGISSLQSLQHLDVSGNSLIDLEGVSKLSALVNFYAHGNQLGRVETYVDNNKNKSYDLGEPINDESGNGKRDTDPLIEIRSLPKLTNLYLYDNLIKTVSSIEDLPNLQTLLLSGNQLEIVRSLGNFKNLKRLSLSDNRLNELDGLGELTNLQHLYLVENRIVDLRPIEKLTMLKELRLQRNQFVDLKSLSNFNNLQSLFLSNNFIYSIKPIVGLEKLKRLSLSGNCLDLENQKIREQLNLFRARGVYLVSGNQKKRSIEAEQLVFSMIGHPKSNSLLGNYLELNGYLRLMDFAEDNNIDENDKLSAYLNWRKALMNGTFRDDLPFPGK